MPTFLVQWKFTAESISLLRSNPQDRLATSISLAESYGGTVVSFYNRVGEYDGIGIFTFSDTIKATAHSMHALSTGAFEKHECELLLTPSDFREALTISRDVKSSYQPPNAYLGRSIDD